MKRANVKRKRPARQGRDVTSARRPRAKWFAFLVPMVAAGVVVAFGACSDKSSPAASTRELLTECEEYITAYNACFSKLTGSAQEATRQHVAAFMREVDVTGKDDRARENMRTSCATRAQRVKDSCR